MRRLQSRYEWHTHSIERCHRCMVQRLGDTFWSILLLVKIGAGELQQQHCTWKEESAAATFELPHAQKELDKWQQGDIARTRL